MCACVYVNIHIYIFICILEFNQGFTTLSPITFLVYVFVIFVSVCPFHLQWKKCHFHLQFSFEKKVVVHRDSTQTPLKQFFVFCLTRSNRT